MSITLVAVSLNEQPLSQPITASFDARGGTIGRADHNTMALPDPERHISRRQAEVVPAQRGYLIRNVGGANPIVVSGRTLAQGESAPLGLDDMVRIGGYLLKVQAGAELDPSTVVLPPVLGHPISPRAPAAQPTTAGSNPFADLLPPTTSPGRSRAPFADLMPPPAGLAPQPPAFSAPAQATRPLLPDDFDPFAPTPPPQRRPDMPAAAPHDPFAGLLPGSAGGSIDDLINAQRQAAPAGTDPLADFMAGLGAPPSIAGTGELPVDPLALFGAAAPLPTAGAPQPDDLPAIHAPFALPRVAAPLPAPAPLTQPAPAPASANPADTAALWSAFCDGAGIELPLAPAEAAERMQLVGRLLRSAIDGSLQLMQVRASTKHELRAEVTVIRQRDNNPLKFSPDGKSGLEQLLQPPLRGFLPGPAAMDDAMQDLVGHAIGTVAGMRAAVEGMLSRFAPDALETKLVGGSMLDNLLPMNRKARLWDLYVQRHRAILEEAQEDFHTLFGRAFLAAYDQQVERLRREHKAP
ncbi:type VI secretion system-associated FHA domain protein TagH [Roseateles sp.]|uniref:type VI secretion system-associated FHA domain protein TagH n=1 Tax=Roseateles sp. TaxID=1971397 RepID=UPI0039EC5942